MNKPDYLLIFLIVVFVAFGFLMLSSATAPYAANKFDDAYYYVKNQLRGLALGAVLFFLFSRLDYRVFKKYANWILGGAILLLLLVFIPGLGATYNYSRSWLKIPFFGSFQPAEFAKLALIIFSAAWLEFQIVGRRASFWKIFGSFLIIIGFISGLVLLQPDMGTAAIIILSVFLIYFIAGAPLSHFGILAALAGLGSFILVKLAPYRIARFTAFLNPAADPQGISYHINQALLAIGSGGFFGVGLLKSRQKLMYLPEVSADSIFAIIGEELGFFICVIFIIALVLFFIRGMRAASAAPDFFGKLLASGISGWIIAQSFINIAAMLSLMPITGLPLPFISYGGSALAATLAGCGILVNISRWE